MARLLSWPLGLKWNRYKLLSGPETIGAGSNSSIGNVTQSITSPFGARYIQLSFPSLRGVEARRARGLVTALHKGANAVRVSFCDWDGMTFSEAGLHVPETERRDGVPWSNGQSWSNARNWGMSKPLVAVAEPVSSDDSVVALAGDFWGGLLGIGDWVGFAPLHFGLYEVTEVIEPGRYRIWPPLRKALTTSDFATLHPVMAMRFLSTNLPDAERGPAFLDGLTLSLFEVFDYDVRDYFTE
ncbi:hypothetical protein IP76_01825 [Rhizobium sp. AAP43]|nr:hypothetical protein IP76_01825 [Rhizobium sp. AAP43]